MALLYTIFGNEYYLIFFTMKYKIRFYAGIVIFTVGVLLSVRPYDPERFRTVHEFTIQCHMRSDHFLEVFGGSLAELDWCLHNTGLSITLYAIIGVGIFLLIKSRYFHKYLKKIKEG